MSESFEIIERVGISNHSMTEAVEKVVKEANSEKRVGWFEVIEQRGRMVNETTLEFQVKVRIGRKLK